MESRFAREPLPERFCNLERLVAGMAARGLDGIVLSTPLNVFYLSGFNGIAHKADEPRPYALLLSRHATDHPILVIADYYLATFLVQPSWVRDIRPFRAVMMPLDRVPQRGDIDRFIPRDTRNIDWVRAARSRYAFDMGSALRLTYTILPAMARKTNVKFVGRRFEPDPPKKNARLGVLRAHMSWLCDYESFRHFIFEVESAPGFVIIDEVSIAQTEANKPLAVSLTISTYYRLGANGN